MTEIETATSKTISQIKLNGTMVDIADTTNRETVSAISATLSETSDVATSCAGEIKDAHRTTDDTLDGRFDNLESILLNHTPASGEKNSWNYAAADADHGIAKKASAMSKTTENGGGLLNVGSKNKPVYFLNGVPTVGTCAVFSDVPSNADFENTKYPLGSDPTATNNREGYVITQDEYKQLIASTAVHIKAGSDATDFSKGTITFKAKSPLNVNLLNQSTASDGTVTQDCVFSMSAASNSTNGYMSAKDKIKVDHMVSATFSFNTSELEGTENDDFVWLQPISQLGTIASQPVPGFTKCVGTATENTDFSFYKTSLSQELLYYKEVDSTEGTDDTEEADSAKEADSTSNTSVSAPVKRGVVPVYGIQMLRSGYIEVTGAMHIINSTQISTDATRAGVSVYLMPSSSKEYSSTSRSDGYGEQYVTDYTIYKLTTLDETPTLPAKILQVKAGDVLYLAARNGSSAIIQDIHCCDASTFLTIK